MNTDLLKVKAMDKKLPIMLWKFICGVCLVLMLVACGRPPTPNPNLLTASAIVSQASHVAYMMTAGITPTPYPNQLTATAIFAEMTQRGPGGTIDWWFGTPTPTPRPTLSAQEVETIRSQWLTDIQNATGFSHPIFEEIVDELMDSVIRDEFENPDAIRNFSPAIQVEGIVSENDDYIVVTIERGIGLIWGRHVLFFRLIEGVPELMSSLNEDTFPPCIQGMSDPTDVNGNDYIDLVFTSNCGGSSSFNELTIVEFRPDGEIVDITPTLDTLVPNTLTDIDADSVMEIQAIGWFCDLPEGYACYPRMTRYYQWNGTAYVDISSTLDESYWATIGAYWENVTDDDCLIPDISTYQVLIDYLAMGRLAEGWGLIEPRLCTDSPQAITDLRRWGESMAQSD